MKEILIFGINRYAELLAEYMTEDGRKVGAFVIDERYKTGQERFLGRPVIFTENVQNEYPPDKYQVILALGYTKMNELRQKKQREFREMGYDIIGYRHPSALILTDEIGEGNVFLENVTIGKHVRIGEGNVFYPCAHVAHHSHAGDFNFFAVSCSIAGSVQIGNNCFFGNNCALKNGIRVHDQTLVGAGCYLSEDTKSEGGVYVPARSILLEGKNSTDML